MEEHYPINMRTYEITREGKSVKYNGVAMIHEMEEGVVVWRYLASGGHLICLRIL